MDKICLVEQCKSGDRDAFGLLYQTYLPAMREVVAYYIHSSDIVWDILHDGFFNSLHINRRAEQWGKSGGMAHHHNEKSFATIH